jgi:hypothetical protein
MRELRVNDRQDSEKWREDPGCWAGVLAEREWRTGLQGRGGVRIERPVRLVFGTG